MKQKLVISDIPWNLNTIIFKCKAHWAIYSNEKKKWKNMIIDLCEEQKLKKINKPCDIFVTFVFADKRRRDHDNLFSTLKFILDGVVEANILKDDSFKEIKSITMKRPKVVKGKKETLIEMVW